MALDFISGILKLHGAQQSLQQHTMACACGDKLEPQPAHATRNVSFPLYLLKKNQVWVSCRQFQAAQHYKAIMTH